MKKSLSLLLLLLSTSVFAMSSEVDVISAEFGVEDHLQQKTLCVTVVRDPQDGELLGIVEDIYDCFYARQAKRSPDQKLQIDLTKLKNFDHVELRNYLQTLDTHLKFYFSDGE